MQLKTLIEDSQRTIDHVECEMSNLLAIIGDYLQRKLT